MTENAKKPGEEKGYLLTHLHNELLIDNGICKQLLALPGSAKNLVTKNIGVNSHKSWILKPRSLVSALLAQGRTATAALCWTGVCTEYT